MRLWSTALESTALFELGIDSQNTVGLHCQDCSVLLTVLFARIAGMPSVKSLSNFRLFVFSSSVSDNSTFGEELTP